MDDQGVEPGTDPEQHQLVPRVGFEPGMTALKSSTLNHLAILPPSKTSI